MTEEDVQAGSFRIHTSVEGDGREREGGRGRERQGVGG
jgi:hypothetical protein